MSGGRSAPHAGRLYLPGQIRFALLPSILVLTVITFLGDGRWAWLGGALLLLTNVVADELGGDYRETITRPRRLFLRGALYVVPVLMLLIAGLMLMRVAGASSPLANLGTALGVAHSGLWSAEAAAVIFSTGIVGGWAAGSIAHELMHRANRFDWYVGQFLLAWALYAPSAIEHVYGHHVRVGLAEDVATVPRGQTFWRYLPRALRGAHVGAARIEARRLAKRGQGWASVRNRLLQGLALEFALLAAVVVLAGWPGLIAMVVSAAFSIVIVECGNYVGHYGLVRVEGQPVRPRHSWNAPRFLSSSAMVNLPRHSDHHRAATTPYWELAILPDAPVYPYGTGIMAVMAFKPSLFFRILAPVLADWDDRLASDGERALVGKPPRG